MAPTQSVPSISHQIIHRTQNMDLLADGSSVQNITFGVLTICIAAATLLVAYLQYKRTVASQPGALGVQVDRDTAFPYDEPPFRAHPAPAPAPESRTTSDDFAASGNLLNSLSAPDLPLQSLTQTPQEQIRGTAASSTAPEDLEDSAPPSLPVTLLVLSIHPAQTPQAPSSTQAPPHITLEDRPNESKTNGQSA